MLSHFHIFFETTFSKFHNFFELFPDKWEKANIVPTHKNVAKKLITAAIIQDLD